MPNKLINICLFDIVKSEAFILCPYFSFGYVPCASVLMNVEIVNTRIRPRIGVERKRNGCPHKLVNVCLSWNILRIHRFKHCFYRNICVNGIRINSRVRAISRIRSTINLSTINLSTISTSNISFISTSNISFISTSNICVNGIRINNRFRAISRIRSIISRKL